MAPDELDEEAHSAMDKRPGDAPAERTAKNRAKRTRKRSAGKGPSRVARWQVVENLVAAVERQWNSVPGTSVKQKAMVKERHGERTREVDILVELPMGPRRFLLGVDVKDKARPLDVEAIEQLAKKFEALPLHRYCIVSTSGFTEHAREKARACEIDLRMYRQVLNGWVFPEMSKTVMRYATIRCVDWHPFWENGAEENNPAMAEWNGVSADGVQITCGNKTVLLAELLQWLGDMLRDGVPGKERKDLGDEFTLSTDFNREFVNGFINAGRDLPFPSGVTARFRREWTEKSFDNVVYETEGTLAQASVIEDPFGNPAQLNAVTTWQDGKLNIHVSFAPATPKRSRT
jgi:hypothetical protein